MHTLENVSGRKAREVRTHPLFRDCVRGFALRVQLTEGMLESQKELLRKSIPERAQYILTWYEKKYNKLLQRPLTEKDYEHREVGMQISEERWLEYWAKAVPNTAADTAGSHNNLFKSVKKVVRCEATGEDVAPASHVLDWFRRLLNVTLNTAHIYLDWAEEILCTLVKVTGSQAVNDTTPLGLVAILRNALEGIEFDRIQNTLGRDKAHCRYTNWFQDCEGHRRWKVDSYCDIRGLLHLHVQEECFRVQPRQEACA